MTPRWGVEARIGPFAEGTEHLGGFTLIEVEELDEALAWAGELVAVLILPIEVRPVAQG